MSLEVNIFDKVHDIPFFISQITFKISLEIKEVSVNSMENLSGKWHSL